MSPVRLSSIEEPVRSALAFNDVGNRHNIQATLTLLHPDCSRESSTEERYAGKEAIAAYWGLILLPITPFRSLVKIYLGLALGLFSVGRQNGRTKMDRGAASGVFVVDVVGKG